MSLNCQPFSLSPYTAETRSDSGASMVTVTRVSGPHARVSSPGPISTACDARESVAMARFREKHTQQKQTCAQRFAWLLHAVKSPRVAVWICAVGKPKGRFSPASVCPKASVYSRSVTSRKRPIRPSRFSPRDKWSPRPPLRVSRLYQGKIISKAI